MAEAGRLNGPAPPTAVWVLSDGKAGDENQCLAITEALGLRADVRRVHPSALFAVASPRGPADPHDLARILGSGGPPDLVVASGRRAVPYLRALKRRSGGRCFTVFLKDPRVGTRAADLIWVSEHDRLRGRNVLVTLTAPHRWGETALEAARRSPEGRVAALGSPRVAVLIGGDSRHHRFTATDIDRLADGLRTLSEAAALAVTLSRRTPERLRTAVSAIARPPRHFLWDGHGPNPYGSMLAMADAIVVTADSTNMVGDAVATGRPVLVFEPSGGHAKIARFLSALEAQGAVRPFTGRLEAFGYEPIDSTPEIAAAVQLAFDRHRAALGCDGLPA